MEKSGDTLRNSVLSTYMVVRVANSPSAPPSQGRCRCEASAAALRESNQMKVTYSQYSYRLQSEMESEDILAQISALLEGRAFSLLDEDRPGAILRDTPWDRPSCNHEWCDTDNDRPHRSLRRREGTPGLTRPNEALERLAAATVPGMAHWSGTGPEGATCGKCTFYGTVLNHLERLIPKRCRKYSEMVNKCGPEPIPKITLACRHFHMR